MKKAFAALLAAIVLSAALAGCSQQGQSPAASHSASASEASSAAVASNSSESGSDADASLHVTVTVGDVVFSATAEDTEAGRELASRLPLTLDMSELGGVEKYFYTGEPFGGEPSVPGNIAAGEIMAYSGDCLVLFYATHPNDGYSYVPLARIDDPEGLAGACGGGTVTVTFEAAS